MSIRRISLGAGYKYLMSSVARGDGASSSASNLTRYYAESGTPPGWFLGAGLAGLADGAGVEVGSKVSEQHLFRMLGMLQDPLTGEQLGRPPTSKTVVNNGAARRPVAGFDLTFSAPKSVSAMWGVADANTQRLIYEAHVAALKYTITYAEREVFHSRSGKGGVLQEDVRGVVSAAFDHWDSRAGDPQLHTHVAVMNRVQTSDGSWRTIDSRALFKSAVTLSALYNGVLSDYLTDALGVGWEPTSRGAKARPQYEIVGVPAALREEFSQRTKQIDDIVAAMSQDQDRELTERERLQRRQQATLMTRPDKQHHSLADLTTSWRARATRYIDAEPTAWVASLRHRDDLPRLRSSDLDDAILRDAAKVALHLVEEKRATFTRANVLAEAHRQLHGVRFTTPDERVAVAERTTALALDSALLITPPELAHTPARFQREDGTSRFRHVGSALYASRGLLDAEARLLDAGRAATAPVAAEQAVQYANRDGRLSAEQAGAVRQIVTSGRVVDVLVGAAGTGKSRAMGMLREAWENEFGEGSVIGLAPSATAADVLGNELAIPTENTAKWLMEAEQEPIRLNRIDELTAKLNRQRNLAGRIRLRNKIDALGDEVDRWRLHPNQLVIVDEASLAGTFTLDAIARRATEVGAKVVLVGDWAQLSAVTAGGAFHMLVSDRTHAPELDEVRRFRESWERAASIGLRLGRADVLGDYAAHNRIIGGDREQVIASLFDAWKADVERGLEAVMIAGDNDTVRQLNGLARAARVAAGEVTAEGIRASSGLMIGVGDRVVTRRNNRSLATGAGWVKNGDQWTVTRLGRDGSCFVKRADAESVVHLPRDYVHESVDLAYATNAHRAQGRTVDTAHAFITATTSRELLYVMATRGRSGNRIYVDTAYDPDPSTLHVPLEPREPIEVLAGVLANEGGDRSATETIRTEWNDHASVARLWSEYETIAAVARADRYRDVLAASGLTPEQVLAVTRSESYGPLLSAMNQGEARGLDLPRAFQSLVANRTVSDAEDIASVLHHRVDRWVSSAGLERTDRTQRIVGLFPHAVGVNDPDVQRGLDERAALIEQRAYAIAADAIDRNQPWVAQLAAVPTEPAQRAAWLDKVAVIAAYRDRWNIHDRTVLGRSHESAEQLDLRALAERATVQALAIHHEATQPESAPVHRIEPELERTVEL
jgi:conjugative relaxase-like TrwC/TraI family protein